MAYRGETRERSVAAFRRKNTERRTAQSGCDRRRLLQARRMRRMLGGAFGNEPGHMIGSQDRFTLVQYGTSSVRAWPSKRDEVDVDQ